MDNHCSKCHSFKALSEMASKYRCRECAEKQRIKTRENQKKVIATPESKARRTAYNRKRWAQMSSEKKAEYSHYVRVNHYKLTVIQFEQLLNEREGKCDICKVYKGRKLHIDHCHTTGKIRGLLCNKCNLGLGCLEDNIEGLERALNYLRENS